MTNRKAQLPAWLTSPKYSELKPNKGIRRTSHNYLEKTLLEIQAVIAGNLQQARGVDRSGFMHQLEPRTKVLAAGALIITTAMVKTFYVLLLFNCLTLLAVLCSGLKFSTYCKRVWIPVSLFAGIAALPGIFNLVVPGQPVWEIYQGSPINLLLFNFPGELYITRQGLTAYGFIVARPAAVLGIVLLLQQTTKWTDFTKALSALSFPAIFIMVLDLTYRYLFLFLLLLGDYTLGRKSRLVGRESALGRLRWVGISIAGFFRIACQYSQEITQALLMRGYTGRPELQTAKPITYREGYFAATIVLLCVLMLGGNYLDVTNII